jgi:hypothetical protein
VADGKDQDEYFIFLKLTKAQKSWCRFEDWIMYPICYYKNTDPQNKIDSNINIGGSLILARDPANIKLYKIVGDGFCIPDKSEVKREEENGLFTFSWKIRGIHHPRLLYVWGDEES